MRRQGAVLAALAAAVTVGCGGPELTPEQAARVGRGREVYAFESCAGCHGAERQGGKSAPPLVKVYRHWRADDLVAYLKNPRGYPKDRRLEKLAKSYPQEMAGLPAASDERLADLAAFLLSR